MTAAGLTAAGHPRTEEVSLSARLDALAGLIRMGRARESLEGFGGSLLDDSEALLRRAGDRLRLSSSHTVVALGGGTGSGKSTLFNAMSGATFSAPGVTRPTTRHVHACVWGMQGAAPLLDWLGVQRRHRYARASVLDSGESALNGLILLDLPDHDSVITESMAAVDRLSKLADMLIWVLDPQKYADAAVHNRYLIPLAGHAGVFTVVLSQIDLLTAEQVTDCENDLRRLLDAEGLDDTPLLPVSARTGAGLDDLRALLTDAVSANMASSDRISADIDSVIGGFAIHAAGPVAPERALMNGDSADAAEAGQEPPRPALPPWEISEDDRGLQPAKPPWEDAASDAADEDADQVRQVPVGPAWELISAFARAAGLAAVAETMAGVREARAAKFAGWPLARLVRRGRDPVRALRAAAGRAPAAHAQQSEVDNAITAFADAVGGGLPAPWSASLREAARSGSAEVPAALSVAVNQVADPGAAPKVPPWWRLITFWQWLLTVGSAAGVVWAVLIAVAHGGQRSTLLSDVSLIPWLLVMVAAMLLLGWLTAAGCQNMVLLAADRERERAEQAMRTQVAWVASRLVLVPTGREIGDYEQFRQQLAVVSATHP
jgi:energy-coupling factor transporter ATP-binding protein EcfA2